MAQGVILGQTPNTNNLLPLDGSRAMTGTLQANAGILVGKINDSPHSNIYTSPGQSLLVNSYNTLSLVNTSTDNNITRIDFTGDSTSKKISFTISNVPSLVLRPSSISVENNRITNLADGTSDTDAATVGQVKTLLSNQIPYIIHSSGNCIVSPTSAYLYKNSGNKVSYRFTDDEANIIASWLNINHNTSAWPILNLYSAHGKNIGKVDMESESVIFTISLNYVGTVLYYWN